MPTDERDPRSADDELTGGAEREPLLLPRWVTIAAALLAVVVAGYVALRPGTDPTPRRTATPTADRLLPPAPITLTPAPGQTGYPGLLGPLALTGTTCVTLRRGGFTVAFGLQNSGLGRVTVLSVSAHLPTGGLQPTGGQVPARTSCGGASIDPGTTTVLEPGDRLPVSVGFRTPAGCPAPYPVQVDVAIVNVGENPGTQRIPVLSDLGGYQEQFPACSSP